MLDRISDEFGAHPVRLPDQPTRSWPQYWWLNLLLLASTFVSTTVFGFALNRSFVAGRDFSTSDWISGFRVLWSGDRAIWAGIGYSVPLILILLAHEMGHYSMCRKWNVKATLPFFGPSPTLMGTIGAFIWIRSPIYRRRALFDIGISGPILGFAALIPFLVIGIWKSKVIPGLQPGHDFAFGVPVLFRILEGVRFPGAATSQIVLHPMAMAAWAGLLATAINLMPVGQLDGGHIVYAAVGERGHRYVSWSVLGLLVIGGLLYRAWWIWGAAMFFLRRHPLVHDAEPIGWERRFLCFLALAMLLLAFSVVPVSEG